jgi:hypothetical protein
MIPVFRDVTRRGSGIDSPTLDRSHFRKSVFTKEGTIVPRSSITSFVLKPLDEQCSNKASTMYLDVDDESDPDRYKQTSLKIIQDMRTSRPMTAQQRRRVFKNTKDNIANYLTDIYKDNISLRDKIDNFTNIKMNSDYMSQIKYYSKYASEKVCSNFEVMEDMEDKYKPLFATAESHDKYKFIRSGQSSRMTTPLVTSGDGYSKANSWKVLHPHQVIPKLQLINNLTSMDGSHRLTFADEEYEKDIRIINRCDKIDKRIEKNKKGILKVNILKELSENYTTGNNDFKKAMKEYDDVKIKLNTSHDYDEEKELRNECIDPEINAYRPGTVSLSSIGKIRTLQPKFIKNRLGFNSKVSEFVRPKEVKKRVPLYMQK